MIQYEKLQLSFFGYIAWRSEKKMLHIFDLCQDAESLSQRRFRGSSCSLSKGLSDPLGSFTSP